MCKQSQISRLELGFEPINTLKRERVDRIQFPTQPINGGIGLVNDECPVNRSRGTFRIATEVIRAMNPF